MKKCMKEKITKGLISISALMMLSGSMLPVYAKSSENLIAIEKPEGWQQADVSVRVTVDGSSMGESFSIAKVEAKIGENGKWSDITSSMQMKLNGNNTVYVRVTDAEGNVYEQNRSIKCFDQEKPTLSASLTDGILYIQGNDTISGIKEITVNGTSYTNLTDGGLKVQLTQSDFTTKKIEITATDNAGNVSEKYSLKNPYYEWAVRQAEQQNANSNSGANNMSTGTSTGTTEAQTTSPLPQDARPSEPTDARGTVTEQTQDPVQDVEQTRTEGSKVFYTITTKSGKTFYLVIDNSMQTDNVFFLTEVDEQDLMNFTLSDTVTLPHVDTVHATVEEEEPEVPETEESTEETEEEVVMPEDQSGMGQYIIIGIVAAGALAGAYYFKVYKKKQEDYDDDDLDDEYEEGFQEGKDEPEESEESDEQAENAEDDDEIPEETDDAEEEEDKE